MHHILGNKVLEYDVDDRGVIVDEREIDRTVNHKPNIADWVKEHMVFWYDMSKPVDVYAQNFNDWQNHNPNSVSITNNKIVVNGLIDNFRIASIGKETESFSVFIEGLGDKTLVYRVKLDENSDQITNIKLKDGENVLPHSFATTVAFMGVSGVTDYIGLTITQLPSGQSVPTNEILKANPYLQDHSGNNRPLKLNNFLFAAMSGVGGYETNFSEEVYPNALVTDGVDDYGVVENLQQGVKVLFMTAIPLRLYKTWYAQDSFSIYGQPGITAYNFRNTGGVTYLDGILNEAEVSNNLLNKKKTVTIVNPTDGGNNSIIFFNSYGSSYMNMAFYNSIGFDSVPTKQNDGFTEQDLIDYVLENLITK